MNNELPKNEQKPVGAPPSGNTPPPPVRDPQHELEDAGTRALSEALRSSFFIVKIVMVLLVIVFFASGVFTVPSQQKAIILRFGKPVGSGEGQLLGPGLHWSFPYPIDEVVKIPIGEMQTVRSRAGWYATTPEAEQAGQEPEPGPSLNPATDGYTISADGNIMHVRADVRYRIVQPLNYVLNFVSASNVVQNIVDHSLFYASSLYNVNQALREDKAGFQDKITARVKQLADELNLGISVESLVVVAIPPRQVRSLFEQVSVADIERRKAADTAQALANTITSTAQGQANTLINQGKSEAARLTSEIVAEAKVFQDQIAYYQKDPDLFRARLQAETMSRILTNVQDVMFLPKSMEEVRYQLNRAPRESKTADENGQQR
jgi:modulator of FtsH protease HflK